jgi:plastocyanin
MRTMTTSKRNRAALIAAAAGIAIATIFAGAAGSAASGAPGGQEAMVKIDNFTFNPPSLVVGVGATVTWMNGDDIPHTVVSTSHAFRSKALDTDDSFSFTFGTPGVYEYFCSLHPHMKATIVVEAAQPR